LTAVRVIARRLVREAVEPRDAAIHLVEDRLRLAPLRHELRVARGGAGLQPGVDRCDGAEIALGTAGEALAVGPQLLLMPSEIALERRQLGAQRLRLHADD